MGLHRNLGAADLHDPKGKSPTPLDVDVNLTNAYEILDTESEKYFSISTLSGDETVEFGNSTLNQKFTLAGTGLFTSGGGHKYNSTSITVGTVDMDATSFVVLADTTGGPITYNLSNPAAVPNQVFFIIDQANNFAASNFTLTTDGSGELIDGSASDKVITESNARIWLFCDGTDWYTLLDDAATSATDIVADTLKVNGDTLVANLPGYEDKVGVGTAIPQALLDAGESSAGDKILFRDAHADPSVTGALGHSQSGDTSAWIANKYNSDAATFGIRMKGSTASEEVVTVLGNGNVGIGVSPTETLDVNGTLKVAGIISGVATPSAATDAANKAYVDAGGDGSIEGDTLIVDTETLVANLVGYEDRVGVGTASPDEKLHVKNTAAGDATLKLETTSGGDPTIVFETQTNRDSVIKFQEAGTNSGSLKYAHNGDVFKFIAGSTTDVRAQIGETTSYFTSDVGIGTATPSTKLHVDGTVTVEDAVRIGSVAVATELLTVDGDVHVSGQVKGLSAPTDVNDATTKAYVDGVVTTGWDGTSGANPALGGNLDCNGNDIGVEAGSAIAISGGSIKATTGYGVHDEADLPQLLFTKTASALSWLNITNSAAGGNATASTSLAPILQVAADASETDVDFGIQCKGTGAVTIRANANGGAAAQSAILRINTETNTSAVNITVPLTDGLTSYTLTLPVDDGLANQVLETDGSGVLSWSTPSSGGGYTVSGISADPAPAVVDYYYVIDSSGGAVSIALPNAGATASGKTIGFKARHGATNPVTLNRGAGGNIDGAASNYVMSNNMEAVELICDGTDWWVKS